MTAFVPPHLIDIGSNLSDDIFHGGSKHPNDFTAILERARAAGVRSQLLTGDSLKGSRDVLVLSKQHDGLFTTAGVHPCRANEPETYPGGPSAYFKELSDLISSNKGGKGKVRAVGETGLDYDRLFLCPKEVQLRHFPPQLELASEHDLPLFLHSRAAHDDMVRLIKAHDKPLRGVVHSHSGSLQEALDMIELGFFIGINGCSLKTPENVECVRQLPLDKLMVESDCPWCEIRPSHASHAFLSSIAGTPLEPLYRPPSVKKEKWVEGKTVRGRNEPFSTGQVAWVIAQLKGVELEEVASVTTKNATELFGIE